MHDKPETLDDFHDGAVLALPASGRLCESKEPRDVVGIGGAIADKAHAHT